MKKLVCLLLMLMVPIMAKPTELLIQKKISHKTKGNLQGYKSVKVDLYARDDLETSLWTETHGSIKFHNGNMTLKVGDVNPLSWDLLHSIEVPIIGLTIDGEMVYIKPSAELFSYLAEYSEEAGSVDYKNIKNVPLVSTDMIEDRAITFEKLNLTKQDILDLGISSHSESDVLSIVQSNPSDFEQNVNGTFYESIKNTSINNMTSAGYGVSAQNGAVSGVFHAHKDINGVGRVQMGSMTNATVDILQNNEKAIMIDETSVVFNKPFNLNLSGSYSAGDLLVYDGTNWNGLNQGSTNQVLGVTSSGVGWIDQTDVLSIIQSNPSDFEQSVNGTFYETIKNTSINNMTSAGYGVSAQNGAVSGVFHAHKDTNGVGRVQMGSTTNATVDILQNNEKAIMIDETSVVFNKPFNLNLSGSYSAGDLLVYDGTNWNGLNKGSTNQVLGVTGSGVGWIDQTASDYIEGSSKKQYVEVRTTNNTAGSYAGFRASADSGNIKGVFQSHKKSDSGNTVEFGSETNHDVKILRNGKHAVTITLNDAGEIVVRANKLEVENIKATSIDATNLSSDSLTTTDLSSTTSSLGTATSTSLASTDISASGTSSLSSTTVTDFEIIAKKNALSIPAGSILPFAGSVVPEGYLLCDGSSIDAVSSTKYTALWNAIGTTYGGLAKSNFNVPNLKGYFLRGSSDLNSVGVFQSDATAVNGLRGNTTSNGSHNHYSPYLVTAYQINSMYAQFGTHSGSVSSGIKYPVGFSKYEWNSGGTKYAYTSTSGNHSHNLNLNGDPETRPKNMSVNYIIKY